MSGRTLFSATMTLFIGLLAAVPASAQNLEAGKSPAQIFSGTCTACHRSPRGLLKTVPPGSLAGFLREHYTTSPDMAKALAGYLIGNGAADRSGRPERAARPERGRREAPEARRDEPQEQRSSGGGQTFRWPWSQSRPPEETRPGPQAVEEGKPSRRARHKRGRRGEPAEEAAPKAETRSEPKVEAKPEAKPESKPTSKPAEKPAEKPVTAPAEAPKPAQAAPEPAKSEPAKSEPAKSEPAKSEPAKSEPAKPEPPATRSDPVPQVTPAPKASESDSKPVAPASPPPAPAAPATPPPPPPVNSGNTDAPPPPPPMSK